MIDRVYAIHTDEECERLDAQALLGGVSDHLRHVPAQPGMRILDAGCGSGSMAREIARAAPETITVGIDLRDKYIDHARMRATAEGLQNLTFQTGDVRELPFPEGTFDIVWTKYLLQWVAQVASRRLSTYSIASPENRSGQLKSGRCPPPRYPGKGLPARNPFRPGRRHSTCKARAMRI